MNQNTTGSTGLDSAPGSPAKLARVAFSLVHAVGALARGTAGADRTRALELSRRRLTLNPRLLFR